MAVAAECWIKCKTLHIVQSAQVESLTFYYDSFGSKTSIFETKKCFHTNEFSNTGLLQLKNGSRFFHNCKLLVLVKLLTGVRLS